MPETRYVTVDGSEVAYQVLGEGATDLVYFWGLSSHVELIWEDPYYGERLRRLASFSRLILFDRRGTGASDRIASDAVPTFEQQTEDIKAVLDAVGSERAAIYAVVDAGPIAMLFTAMHPERVQALVLDNTSARYLAADDYPIGASRDDANALVDMLGSLWGTPELYRITSPDLAVDEEWLSVTARIDRSAMTPRSAAAMYRYVLENSDVRAALPLIKARTLVLHNKGNPVIPVSHGRYLAERIGSADLRECESDGITWVPEPDELADVVGEFVTGSRPAAEVDRVLTTVLFTDICGSTATAAAVGDRRWRAVLNSHDRAVRKQIVRFRGREVKHTGDGFVASFDGPARAIRCGQAIIGATAELGIEVRVGLHTGECEVRGNDLGGLAVHIAARVGALARPGEVLVSRTVADLVAGSGIPFADRGEHELKGVPGQWRLVAVNA